MLGFILGSIFGGTVGVFTMCLCMAAGQAEKCENHTNVGYDFCIILLMHPRKGMSIEICSVKSWYHHWMHPRKRMNIELVNKKHEKGGILPSFLLHIK